MHPAAPRRARRPLVRAILLASAAALLATDVGAQDAGETWRGGADVVARYSIEVRLREGRDVDDDWRIAGHEVVEWTNTSAAAVEVVYLHLYANAFRNLRSTFLREAAAAGWERPDDLRFGRIDVSKAALVTGEELTLEFVSPDDGNADDRTVARVVLPRPVPAGQTIGLRFTFSTVLPSVVARMGRQGEFVMAAQWYPKLGRLVGASAGPNVHEGWYCQQYHRNGEFAADFADYDVRLRVPERMVVGATGRHDAGTDATDGGLRSETWSARSVVDFAWTASSRFERHVREIHPLRAPARMAPSDDPVQKERDRVAALLGMPAEGLTLPAVQVTVLLQPEHERQLERHFEAARVALGLYGLWLGPYPYETLTIVDPARGARHAGGMEYPQLVTAGTRIANPPETLRPEGVIVHEIGHQWFMNLLASNEAEEAWLDEGLNTYFTARALDIAYGPRQESIRRLDLPFVVKPLFAFPGLGSGWPEWIGLPDWASPPELEMLDLWRDLPLLTALPTPAYIRDPMEPLRRSYLRSVSWDPVVRSSWEYVDRASYGVNAYARPALFVATLRRTLHARLGPEAGERAFVAAVRSYARTWRFRHPTTPDFLASFGSASGLEMGPLVVALLRSTGNLDYAVEEIRTLHEPPLEGWSESATDGETVLVRPADDAPEGDVQTTVLVRRRGEVVVPVRLQVTRQHAPEDEAGWETVEWDGRDRWRRFVFAGEIAAARLYPDDAYLQDTQRSNDSRTVDASRRPAVKWGVRFLLWIENAALSYGRFF